MKNSLLVGMDANNIWGLGTRRWQGATLLFIAQRSWINLYPWTLGFLKGEVGVLKGLVQGIINPCAL